MNSKNKNIVLFVCLFIILAIFVDLIFNFSNVIVENYTNEVSSSYNATTFNPSESSSANQSVVSEIKSVVSKMTGKVFNIYK